jgi:phosphate-selective porin OprO/OprP
MRGIAAAVTGALLFGFGANAMADSTDDIINALIAKGVLTEEEGALLQKGREGEKFGASKKPVNKEKDNMFSVESGDGNNSVALTGRMHFDVRGIDSDKEQSSETDRDTKSLADNFEVRRARIGVKGKFAKDFSYEVVGNLVGSNTNTLDVAFLNWAKYEPFQIRVGQFKQPFTLEELTSSNNIDFMERSYVNQITPAKKPGVMFHGVPTKGLTYAVSTYQQNNWGEESTKEDGKSFAGRATMNFAELAGWNTKESVLHIGAAGFNSQYDFLPTTSSSGGTSTNGSLFAFRSGGRGLTNLYRAQIAGTAVSTDGFSVPSPNTAQIDNKAYGVEFAAAKGPFKIQSEYTSQTFDGKSGTTTMSADVKAYYVEALWMLTGENYAEWYKNGVWGAVKPKSNYDFETGKGNGAWEVGFRYDAFDVSDTKSNNVNNRFQGAVDTFGPKSSETTNLFNTCGQNTATADGSACGGGAKSYTAGLKWVLNPNMRMLLNYTHTKFDNAFAPVDVSSGVKNDKEDLIMLRTQVAF